MKIRIASRVIAPLVACGIAGSATIVGGACLPTTTDPAKLRTGLYVLTQPGVGALPGLMTDSTGRRLRVVADTLSFDVASQTYQQHSTVAITPPGGTEQAPVPFIVSRRSFTKSSDQTFVLPTTLYGGMIFGSVATSSTMFLQVPNSPSWRYDYR